MGDESPERGKSLGGDALQQFAERFAQREDLSKIVGGKIGAGASRTGTLSADLNDADDFSFGENGRAEDFLDGFRSEFHDFKDRRMPCHGEIVVDFGPAIARGSGGEGGITGEGNETHVFQGFGHEKMEVPPPGRNAHDGDFILFYGQRLGDFFRHRSERELRCAAVLRAQGGGDAFEFVDEAGRCAHWEFVIYEVWGQQGFGPADPVRHYFIFERIHADRQEDFESFVSAERTVQLASPHATAYTDFAAISQCSSGFARGKPVRTHAAERACPQRKPSLIPVTSFENFIPLPVYFPLGRFWQNISGRTAPRS